MPKKDSGFKLSDTVGTSSDSEITGSRPVHGTDLEDGAYPVVKQGRKAFALETFYLGFQSLGAIYGDIGTSPLYTYSSIFPSAPPSVEQIMGATSVIFWSFTLVVIIKYCLIVFYFGPNHTEGGAVAVYAKIASHLNIAPKGVDIAHRHHVGDNIDDLLLSHSKTNEDFIKGKKYRSSNLFMNFVYTHFSWLPLGLCFAGVALIFADGLLTPTTSVLSAVAGIAIPAPNLSDKVVLISCIILALLFVFQRAGSGIVSMIFAPIIFLWMLSLIIVGVYNITFEPQILKAFNPAYAIQFLKSQGIDGMGAVILPITGTETMFADIGHFSVWSVRLTMMLFCYPCLILAYFGQAARMIENPEIYTNVFYLTLPGNTGGGIYWFVFVIATLATIIASQATILGVSSLYGQLAALDCVPKLAIIHTSKKIFGKIYIPVVNWVFMVLVILTTIGYQNTNNVTDAYGLCIALVFFTTTCQLCITIYGVYKIHWGWPLLLLISFGTLDMCFVVAGLRKIEYGAWFPVMVSCLVGLFFVSWRWGRSLKVDHEYDSRVSLNNIFEKKGDDSNEIYYAGTDVKVQRFPGIGIFHTNAFFTLTSPNTVPSLFFEFVNACPGVHDVTVFLGVRFESVPYVDFYDRIHVSPIANMPGMYKAIAKFGFMDKVVLDEKFMDELKGRL